MFFGVSIENDALSNVCVFDPLAPVGENFGSLSEQIWQNDA